MASTTALLVWNVVPGVFPCGAHPLSGSAPLALIAIALAIYQVARRPPRFEWLRALIVAAAFACWAANQLFPDIPEVLLLNDIAIALFVLDVFLLIVSAPPADGIGPPEGAAGGVGVPHSLDVDSHEAHPNVFP
jgi:hypothetical protein